MKEAFLDERLAGLGLSSANSINIGRLLPQAVYYVASWLDAGAGEAGDVIREELGFVPDMPEPWRDWKTRAVRVEKLGSLDYDRSRDRLLRGSL